MKTKHTLLLSLLGMLASLVVVQALKAQDAPTGTGQNESIKFSGSDLKSEDVISKVDVIFVGKITQIGMGNTKAAGRSAYHGVQVKVVQVFRGIVDAQVTATLYATFEAGVHEQPPKIGGSYIFFAHKNAPGSFDQFTVLKLLPATDDNSAKVKALIAAAPAGK